MHALPGRGQGVAVPAAIQELRGPLIHLTVASHKPIAGRPRGLGALQWPQGLPPTATPGSVWLDRRSHSEASQVAGSRALGAKPGRGRGSGGRGARTRHRRDQEREFEPLELHLQQESLHSVEIQVWTSWEGRGVWVLSLPVPWHPLQGANSLLSCAH